MDPLERPPDTARDYRQVRAGLVVACGQRWNPSLRDGAAVGMPLL